MSEGSDLQSLLSSAGLVFVGTVLASISRMAERIVIARYLSPSAYGEVNIALAILTLGSTLALFGLNQGVTRYVSRTDSETDVRGTWMTGLLISELLCVGLVIVLFAGQDIILQRLFDSAASRRLLQLIVLALPLVVGLEIGVSGIRGMENTVYRTYAKDIAYPMSRIGLVVAVLFAGGTVASLGYAYLLAAGIGFLAATVLFNRLFPIVGAFRVRAVELMKFSAPLVLATILVTLLSRTDTLMLGYFKSSAAVGMYNAAYPLANTLVLLLASFGFLFLPLASRLDADGDREELDSVYKITTKWIFVLTFPVFLLFVSFPSEIIGIFFGERYAVAGTALAILSIGFFTNAAGGRNQETLSALGYPKYNLFTNAAAFGLNVILNLLLIPPYGYVGAAVASAVSYVLLNVLAIAVLDRYFDISPLSKWTTRTFVFLPLVLIPLSLVASHYIPLTVFTLPLVLTAFALLTLVSVTVVGGVQSEDQFLIEFVESQLGRDVPLVWRYIPDT